MRHWLHEKTNKMPNALGEDLDQHGHPPSLISPCYPHEEKFSHKQSIDSTVNIGSVTTCIYLFQKCKYFGNPLLQAN